MMFDLSDSFIRFHNIIDQNGSPTKEYETIEFIVNKFCVEFNQSISYVEGNNERRSIKFNLEPGIPESSADTAFDWLEEHLSGVANE